MRYDGNDVWREVAVVEGSSFVVFPYEVVLVHLEDALEELFFFWLQESSRVDFHLVETFLRESSSVGLELWWIGWQWLQ